MIVDIEPFHQLLKPAKHNTRYESIRSSCERNSELKCKSVVLGCGSAGYTVLISFFTRCELRKPRLDMHKETRKARPAHKLCWHRDKTLKKTRMSVWGFFFSPPSTVYLLFIDAHTNLPFQPTTSCKRNKEQNPLKVSIL